MTKDCWQITKSCRNLVANARIKEAKPWLSFDSDREINEENPRLKNDKICVEWIGNLDKRRLSLAPFEDVNAEDLTDTYVEFIVDEAQIYNYKRKFNRDIGVQVDIVSNERSTQTTAYEFKIDNSSRSNNLEKIGKDEHLCGQSAVENESKIDEKIVSFVNKGTVSNESNLNYSKSFVNMTNRDKMISSVAWHPTRTGYVALAYVDKFETRNSNDLLSIDYKSRKKNLAPKMLKCVNEDDVRINKMIFDKLSSRKSSAQKSSESNGNVSDTSDIEDESEDDTIRLRSPHLKISNKSVYESTDESFYRKIIENDAPITNTDEEMAAVPEISEEWIYKFYQTRKQIKNSGLDSLLEMNDENGDVVIDEKYENTDTESEFELYSLPNFSICEESISDDSDSVEEQYSTTLDTDSSVLIWNYDDDIHPWMILQDKHEITTIKFDSYNGDFLAGGSRSGQLVLWNMNENDFARSRRRQMTLEHSNMIEEFMDSIQIDTINKTIRRSNVVSERPISHSQPITCLEWMHPCLQVMANGKLTDLKAEGRYSKQILTSSTDGSIKIWNVKTNSMPDNELQKTENSSKNGNCTRLELELIYNLIVTNPYDDKYVTSVKIFKTIFPSVTYKKHSINSNASRNDIGDYEFVSELSGKYRQQIMVANDIGELGLISWCEQTVDSVTPSSPQTCKHLWWKICHDDEIASLSQHYRIPTLILATGGRIFSIWDTEYKNGPVWSRKYAENESISRGCFSPFHVGVIYIAKNDGRIDIWNIFEQNHKPAIVWNASGSPISVISAIVPPITNCQLSIADENGNFHVLRNRYQTTSHDDDNHILKNMAKFLQRAKKKRKQCLRWNKTWKEHTTVTDQYNFERIPQSNHIHVESSKKPRDKSTKRIPACSATTKDAIIREQICANVDHAKKLDEILEKIKKLNQRENEFTKLKSENLKRSE